VQRSLNINYISKPDSPIQTKPQSFDGDQTRLMTPNSIQQNSLENLFDPTFFPTITQTNPEELFGKNSKVGRPLPSYPLPKPPEIQINKQPEKNQGLNPQLRGIPINDPILDSDYVKRFLSGNPLTVSDFVFIFPNAPYINKELLVKEITEEAKNTKEKNTDAPSTEEITKAISEIPGKAITIEQINDKLNQIYKNQGNAPTAISLNTNELSSIRENLSLLGLPKDLTYELAGAVYYGKKSSYGDNISRNTPEWAKEVDPAIITSQRNYPDIQAKLEENTTESNSLSSTRSATARTIRNIQEKNSSIEEINTSLAKQKKIVSSEFPSLNELQELTSINENIKNKLKSLSNSTNYALEPTLSQMNAAVTDFIKIYDDPEAQELWGIIQTELVENRETLISEINRSKLLSPQNEISAFHKAYDEFTANKVANLSTNEQRFVDEYNQILAKQLSIASQNTLKNIGEAKNFFQDPSDTSALDLSAGMKIPTPTTEPENFVKANGQYVYIGPKKNLQGMIFSQSNSQHGELPGIHIQWKIDGNINATQVNHKNKFTISPSGTIERTK